MATMRRLITWLIVAAAISSLFHDGSLTATDITPAVRTGNYLCGADDNSATATYQRTTGDDSTFFIRWEVLLGIGQGQESYLDEMTAHGCLTSFYTSPFDMPPGVNLPVNNLLFGKKWRYLRGTNTGERWYMHFYNATSYSGSPTRSVAGTGSMTITDADSVNRVFYYDPGYWGGNTYTQDSRPVFNFLNAQARTDMRNFVAAIMIDSLAVWFPYRANPSLHWKYIYFDNYGSNQAQSAGIATGGDCVECGNVLFTGSNCNGQVWSGQKALINSCRTIMVDGDSLRVAINAGSEIWSDDYKNGLPGGTIVNFEYGFDLLQVKSHPGYPWTLLKLYRYDSTAAANGITFFYCAAGWDQLGTYRNSVRDYYGFSNAQWSMYARLALYLSTRSDSTVLFLMPNSFYGGSYQGYDFNRSCVYYDWSTKSDAMAPNQSYDTLAWCGALQVDYGRPLGAPVCFDSVYFQYPPGADGHYARMYRREYTKSWVITRPMDDADVPWGKRADSLNINFTVTLPEPMRLVLPNGTASETIFTEHKLNPGDGFIFLKHQAKGKRVIVRHLRAK